MNLALKKASSGEHEWSSASHGLGASTAAKQIAQELISFATAQSKATEALMGELSHTSQDVERSVHGLVDRFQAMATTARDQTETVQSLMSSVQTIEMNGESVPLSELAKSIGDVVSLLVEKIIHLSSRSVAMVSLSMTCRLRSSPCRRRSLRSTRSTSRQICFRLMLKSRQRAPARRAGALPLSRLKWANWLAQSITYRTRSSVRWLPYRMGYGGAIICL